MLAKIAMQASHLYTEAAKALSESDGNYSLSGALSVCNAKKDYFEVSYFFRLRSLRRRSLFG